MRTHQGIDMRHANQTRAEAVIVGMQFRYCGGKYVDGSYLRVEQIATVASVRVTKTGRVNFTIEGATAEWSERNMAPASFLQKG